MKTRNRLFAALLALVMLAGLLPVAALAEGDLAPTSINLSTSLNRDWCRPTEKYEAYFSFVDPTIGVVLPVPLAAISVKLDGDDPGSGYEYSMDGFSGTVELNHPNYALSEGKHTLEITFSGAAHLAPCSKTFTFTVGEPYKLTSQITPAGAGTVTFKKNGVEVTQAFEGDSLTVTWTPTGGYVRDNFVLASNGSPVSISPNDLGNPVISWSFTMPGAYVTAGAWFKRPTYSVVAHVASGEGSVQVGLGEDPGAVENTWGKNHSASGLSSDDCATVYARPAQDWSFMGWYGDVTMTNLVSTATKYVVRVNDGNITLHAKFAKNVGIKVGTESTGRGLVACSTSSTIGASEYASTMKKEVGQGTTVYCMAMPVEGYRFMAWRDGTTDAFVSADNPYSFPLNVQTHLYAMFKVAQFHADPGEMDFGTADFGYDDIRPRPVTLRNDTNSLITVTGISGAANYDAAFVGADGHVYLPLTISSDENVSIAVNPKPGLAPGTYNETLTVAYNDGTDQTLSVALRFTVAGTVHTVIFKDGGKTLFTQAVVDGGNAKRPDSDPEKEGGYRFDDWYADDAYNSPFDFENTAITQDMDVFARFVKYYTIKFNLNGGSFQNGGATQDIERDEGERIQIPLWEEDLEYWLVPPADSEYIGVEIDGAFYAPGAIYNVVKDTTVKVRWRSTLQPATYTVGFDANGHGTAPAAQTVKSGEAATKPADPAETGWKFEGWYLDSGCTKAYDFATKVTSDITLYAKWTQDGGDPVSTTSTITFDLGGGTLNGKTGIVTIQAENGTTITLPAPTRKGYTFDYWEGSRYNAGDSYTVNGDHTLTARWKQNSTPVPRTGDESHPALWLSVLLLSAVAMIILLLYARKRKTER